MYSFFPAARGVVGVSLYLIPSWTIFTCESCVGDVRSHLKVSLVLVMFDPT